MAINIEEVKAQMDFSQIWEKVLHYSKVGSESMTEEDIHLLKWYGIYHRKLTPGYFMIRVRVPGGTLKAGQFTATQLNVLGDIVQQFGRDIMDITTRQQIQLRWIRMEDMPEVLRLLSEAGLTTMQTGHDNIRNVTMCPVAGLQTDEVIDTRVLTEEITNAFVGRWDYANLPRKFNITVLGCRDNCTHGEINDIALMPAKKEGKLGFNVYVGGALGSWGTQRALPLQAFVEQEQAVPVCLGILDVYHSYGNRDKRNKARLKFLLDEIGLPHFRKEVEKKLDFPLQAAGAELTHENSHHDHIGVHPQRVIGLNYVGLNVLTGRLRLHQIKELARLATEYGIGEVRLTTSQNIIIPHVPTSKIEALLKEDLLKELRADPLPFARGLIACTGNTYCPFAQIETKDRTRELVDYLDEKIGFDVMRRIGVLEIHASGCPNSCGNPHTGQIGIIGKKVKRDGRLVEAGDIYLGAVHGLEGAFNERWKVGVPFEEMGPLLEELILSYMKGKSYREGFREWCIRTGKIKGTDKDFAPMIKEG